MKIVGIVLLTFLGLAAANFLMDNLCSMESVEETSRRVWIRNNRLGDFVRRLFRRPMKVTICSDDLKVTA